MELEQAADILEGKHASGTGRKSGPAAAVTMKSLIDLLRVRSGAAAIEFAIVAPVFIMFVLTFVGFGIYLGTTHAVQQISADAARTAIAGLDAAERQKLVADFVSKSTMDYFMLDTRKIIAAVADDPKNPDRIVVTIDYDATGLPIWNLYSFAMPSTHIRRVSTIRIGGI